VLAFNSPSKASSFLMMGAASLNPCDDADAGGVAGTGVAAGAGAIVAAFAPPVASAAVAALIARLETLSSKLGVVRRRFSTTRLAGSGLGMVPLDGGVCQPPRMQAVGPDRL
jgi:hypothetical protein